MTCKSIYRIAHDIACNGTGFEWENCEGNQYVIQNGVVINDYFAIGEPIAFWLNNRIGFAVNPSTIPAGVNSALSVRRFLVMNGVQNPNPSAAWNELHTWQLLGQGANGETIIITTSIIMNLYEAAALLISQGAIWGGDLDSGGSVSTKCGGDIISVENRLVANFIAIDIKKDGGTMTTVTRWTGTTIAKKPLRYTDGGEASNVTLDIGVSVKGDEKKNQWIQLIEPGFAAGLWITTAILTNVQQIEEETDPPVDPPPVDPQIVPPDEALFRWKDAAGNVLVTQEYIKRA